MAALSPIIIARFWSKVAVGRDTECWPWKGASGAKGYGRFNLDDRLELAHRLAYQIFHGEIDAGNGYHGTVILHRCDNPACCNPAHLREGSHADNMKDMCEKGRQIPSRIEAGTMLPADIVAAIADDPRPHRTIAEQFGVAKSTVYRIKHGKTAAAAERTPQRLL